MKKGLKWLKFCTDILKGKKERRDYDEGKAKGINGGKFHMQAGMLWRRGASKQLQTMCLWISSDYLSYKCRQAYLCM